MTDPANPLREGLTRDEVVDQRYTVVNRIGSGGMADVYCAQDSQLGRRVALKVLHRRFAADQEFVERFRREASAAAGLQHPNVVQVFDRGEIEGTSYIAMEFLDGRTLKQVVRDEGPLEPSRAIDITVQILRAARFAHKRGVIHRDLKPHNVMVDSEGRVKVTDFGIARAGASDMTETGAIMGTAAYLSPEQAQGHTVAATSDLYSIGIILYELLTGQVPFDAESAVTIALKQVSETPTPPRAINPAVSPELEDVVLRALQKDPARRFADADEFTAALEAVRELPARPDAKQRTGSLTGVYPALEELEERERRGRRFWITLVVVLLALAAIAAGLFLALRPDKASVPRVVGQDADVASARLENQGFEVTIQSLRSDDRPVNEVIRQTPGPGAKVDEGSNVTIYVSSGPGQADVPDVIGDPLKQAREAIEKARFKTSVTRQFSETVPEGRVIETRPGPRTQIDIGQRVTLVVSRGPQEVEVPDVSGLSQSEATARLQEAGFEVAVNRVETADSDPGTAIGTDPEAGTFLRAGQTVELSIAKRLPEVAVPDVRGLTLSQALRRLGESDLEGLVEREAVTSPDEDDVVLDQAPASGKLREGSSVTLTVGSFDPDLDPEPEPTTEPTATPTETATP